MLIVYSVNVLLVVTAFSYLLKFSQNIHKIFFAHDYLKSFIFKILGFSSHELGANGCFTIAKDSIC